MFRTPWGDMWKSDLNISSSSLRNSTHQLSTSSQKSITKRNLRAPQSIKEVPDNEQNEFNGSSSGKSSLSSVHQLPSSMKDEVRITLRYL